MTSTGSPKLDVRRTVIAEATPLPRSRAHALQESRPLARSPDRPGSTATGYFTESSAA